MVELTPSQILWMTRGIRLGRLIRRWLDLAGARFHGIQHRAKAEIATTRGVPSPEAGVIAVTARESEKKRLAQASAGRNDGPTSNVPGVRLTRGDEAIEAARSIVCQRSTPKPKPNDFLKRGVTPTTVRR